MSTKSTRELIHEVRSDPNFTVEFEDTVLTGDDARESYVKYLQPALDQERAFLFKTCDQAPAGHLKWLAMDEDEFSDEEIPSAYGLYYELTYDEGGRVAPTMVVRDGGKTAVAGVQMSRKELADFSRWAFKFALSECEMSGLSLVSKGYFKDLLSYFKSQNLEAFNEAISDDLDAVIKSDLQARADKQTKLNLMLATSEIEKRVERETEARLRAELMVERDAIERSYAAKIVELSRVATVTDDRQRSDALADPMIQQTITKAVQTVADSRRTA